MGQSKAWLPFGPERLLQRVVRLIGAVADPVVVVAAVGQDLPELPAAVRVVRDERHDEGPLQGLATGLAALPEDVDLVYVSAPDNAFLQPAWVPRLVELIADHDLVIPEIGGRFHPLASLCRRAPTLDAARALLAADQRRLTGIIRSLASRVVDESLMAVADPDFATLRNLNTPEEYRLALDLAGLPDRELG